MSQRQRPYLSVVLDRSAVEAYGRLEFDAAVSLGEILASIAETDDSVAGVGLFTLDAALLNLDSDGRTRVLALMEQPFMRTLPLDVADVTALRQWADLHEQDSATGELFAFATRYAAPVATFDTDRLRGLLPPEVVLDLAEKWNDNDTDGWTPVEPD